MQTRPCYEDWCYAEGFAGAPMFRVYTSQSAHFVTDLVGMMDDGTLEYGLRFKPMSPTRIADSRIGQGYQGMLYPGSVRKVATPPALLTDTTDVLAMNMTAVAPTSNTVITVWPFGYGDLFPQPGTSNLNPAAGQTVSGAVLSPIGPASATPPFAFNTHNLSGNVHMIADVVGTFYYPEPVSATAAATLKAGKTAPVAGKASRASTGS